MRLTRLSKEAIDAGAGMLIERHFPASKKGGGKASASRKKKTTNATAAHQGPLPTFKSGEWPPKRNSSSWINADTDSEDDGGLIFLNGGEASLGGPSVSFADDVIELSGDDEPQLFPHLGTEASAPPRKRPRSLGRVLVPSSGGDDDSDDSDDYPPGDEDGFTFILGQKKTHSTPRSKKAAQIIDLSP